LKYFKSQTFTRSVESMMTFASKKTYKIVNIH
jgi:hypothetical protein